MWTISEIKQRGMEAMKKNYGLCLLVSFVLSIAVASGGGGGGSSASSMTSGAGSGSGNYGNGDYGEEFWAAMAMILVIALIITAVVFVIATAIKVFAFHPLEIGCRKFFVLNTYYDKVDLGVMGYGFKKGNYGNIVKVMFFRYLFTFLWTLLFIIPGIIKGYEYRMVPYLLGEDPTLDYHDALEKSKQMMDGQKWNAFVYDLSFIGWILLSVLTCGLLSIFFVNPYKNNADAELFKAIAAPYGFGGPKDDGYARSAQPAYAQAAYGQPQQPYMDPNQMYGQQPTYGQPADPYAQYNMQPNNTYGQPNVDPYNNGYNNPNNQ